MKNDDRHIAVRLDGATLARLDAVKKALAAQIGEPTQADALRTVILAGLDALEQSADPSPPARRLHLVPPPR